MEWSKFSEAIFDHYLHSDRNLIVEACPGSGKTTNIKHLWGLDDKSTVYLVFNKHNQLEAIEKLPKKAKSDILTLNGLGHRVIISNLGRVKLDEKKVYRVIKDNIRFSGKKAFEHSGFLAKMVAMAKMSIEFNEDVYESLIDTYDLSEYHGMFEHTLKVLKISDEMTDVIDFNDQIRFPAIYELSMPSYSNILGDEVQDFSPVQAEMISRLNGRFVLVGDSHQSIYGFRGAMNNSMSYLKEHFQCVELPLSITYRCASRIVQEASEIFPGILPWDSSPEGTVRHSEAKNEQFSGDLLVLCRMNRPLIDLAFDLLRRNIPCHVRGRDIGQGLIRLIDKVESPSVRELISDLSNWKEVEVQKALFKDNETRVQSVNDKYDSLMVFISNCSLDDPIDSVKERINSLFSQGKGICLSTIHKAKGLEASSCYIIESGRLPFRWKGQKSWQFEQEKNIKYVAVTRAKQELVYM